MVASAHASQEFWHASPEVNALYTEGLRAAGYATFATPRTGNRPDGLLTAVRMEDFDVVDQRDILFNDCGDRVATLLHLRPKSGGVSGASALGDMLLVNTHLLFPHNSNSTLIRLRESFKILEYLHEYQERMVGEEVEGSGGRRRLPVVMCGDFNGTIRGSVSRFLQSQGFVSAFEVGGAGCRVPLDDTDPDADADACADTHDLSSYEESLPASSTASAQSQAQRRGKVLSSSRWISHLNHHGECVGVDHVWAGGATHPSPAPSTVS